MRTLLLAAAILLAGCVAPTADLDAASGPPDLASLSAARFDILPGESIFYAASVDATSLHMRLWLPETDEPAPTILVMSPYFGPDSREGSEGPAPNQDAAARPAYWRYQWLIDHFVPRGYAVALVDVRGTGESGGCLEQTGPLQTQDGYDTVEWLAGQPWSNGKVGMYGKSYDAETQQSTATLAPPHLTTIIPVSSVAGQYDYSYYAGVPYTAQTMLVNVFYAEGDGLQPGTTVESHRALPERAGCHPEHFLQGADESGDWNEYWQEREFRQQAENVTASVLYVHGLQDWNVKPSNIRDWFEHLDVPKMALLGQWAHDYPEQNSYESDWSRQDWQELVWRWYDHWLLGRDTGVAAMLGTVQTQDSEGIWRAQTAFPAANATPRAFTWDKVEGYTEPPALTLAGSFLPAQIVPAARYQTDALAEDLRWSGWPTLSLEATLTMDDAHFAVELTAVAPDGERTWLNRAYLSARHRDGLDQPKPVAAGERVTYMMEFFPSDTIVRAGYKLEIAIAPHDDWTSGAGNGHTATIHSATLTIPSIAPTQDAFLDVRLGKPITAPNV